MEHGSGSVEEKLAKSKGKAAPIPELLPRLVPNESADAEKDLPRLEVQLSNLELSEEHKAPTWGTSYFVSAWAGPVRPLRAFTSLPVYPVSCSRSLFCCRFCLPIDRAVKGAELFLELVRKEPRPKDPGTSSGVRVVGRVRVKLAVPGGRHARRASVLPLFAYSRSPAYVGSIRVDMELII